MKKIIGIGALLIAFSQAAFAQGDSDLLRQHPNARNDRQLSELNDRGSVSHREHMVRHHRAVKHHRKMSHHQKK